MFCWGRLLVLQLLFALQSSAHEAQCPGNDNFCDLCVKNQNYLGHHWWTMLLCFSKFHILKVRKLLAVNGVTKVVCMMMQANLSNAALLHSSETPFQQSMEWTRLFTWWCKHQQCNPAGTIEWEALPAVNCIMAGESFREKQLGLGDCHEQGMNDCWLWGGQAACLSVSSHCGPSQGKCSDFLGKPCGQIWILCLHKTVLAKSFAEGTHDWVGPFLLNRQKVLREKRGHSLSPPFPLSPSPFANGSLHLTAL